MINVLLSYRSFENNIYNYLWSRQQSFSKIDSHDVNGNIHTQDVSWERFAKEYWYETRVLNSTCPQEPQGIAAMCDWAIMIPCLFGDVTKEPRTVYIHNDFIHHLVLDYYYFFI